MSLGSRAKRVLYAHSFAGLISIGGKDFVLPPQKYLTDAGFVQRAFPDVPYELVLEEVVPEDENAVSTCRASFSCFVRCRWILTHNIARPSVRPAAWNIVSHVTRTTLFMERAFFQCHDSFA